MSNVDLSRDNPALAQHYVTDSDSQFNFGFYQCDQAEIGEGETIVDIGCGPGKLTAELADRVRPTGCVLGIDPLRDRINEANATYAVDRTNLRFELGTDADLPKFCKNNSCDLVFSASAFHWFPDKPKSLGNITKALKPRGRVSISGVSGDKTMLVQEIRRKVLTDMGLPDLAEQGVPTMPTNGELRTLLVNLGYKDIDITTRLFNLKRKTGREVLTFINASSFNNYSGIVPEERQNETDKNFIAEFEKEEYRQGDEIVIPMYTVLIYAKRG